MTAGRRSTARVLVWISLPALVLASLPTVIAPDFLVQQEKPILETDARIRLFKALVLPVVRTYGVFGDPGGYHYLVDPPDMGNFPPRPSSMALGHLLRAIPFWFVIFGFLVLCEQALARRFRARAPD